MFCYPCSDGESELSSSSSGSEEGYYETAEDLLSKKKSAKPRKPEADSVPDGPQERLQMRKALSIALCVLYRPLQAYLEEKSKLGGRAFKDKIIAELTAARQFKPGSNKLIIQTFAWLTFLGKSTSVVGCNLNFKVWIDPHYLNEEFGGHAGRTLLKMK
ncbi:hypothetical protein CYMTET_25826 [Cymbomonas tetramitiformis]|uniref:Uncharacterized protein n=1 Tax=Cymbomonas tetramitiformis TaxID=36881 RepID=A0AAE0FTT1_9CHLO|nr:hypothetical protein CYMTET_25826 [Cymbomonas tetramitiformis]